MQIDIEDTLIRDIQAYMTSKGITTDVGKYINTLLLEGFSLKKYEQFVCLKGKNSPEPISVEATPEQEKQVNEPIKKKVENGLIKEQGGEVPPSEEATAIVVEKPRRRPGIKITKK